jgi:MSHA biogenesis protein MshI
VAAEAAAGAPAPVASVTKRVRAWSEQALDRLRDWGIPGLGPQARPQNQVGVALLPQGVSLATVLRNPGARPRITRLEFQPVPRQADPGLALRTLMLQSGMQRVGYRMVLSPDEYQLHLVESPDVPDSELRDAVRWRIRDLIDFPIDEAAIDVFDMPQAAGSSREAGRLMCVVVARTPVIAQKAATINRSGGELDVIDIADLALRNLLALTPADATGAALLYVDATYSLILITGESTLYLSRRIWIGAGELAALAGSDEQSADFRRVADQLAMELLRSLEYYEAHFARPPVETLYIAPLAASEQALHKYLAQALGTRVQALDLNQLFDVPAGLDAEAQARGLLAIGAALRQERATL